MLRRGALPFFVIASAALAFALRVAGLGAQSLWYDEGFSVYLASQSLTAITRLTAGDIHPPLYYYLLHGWIALAGTNEFALRFLSLLPSVLTVPVVARLAGRAGAPAAAVGALLAAAAPAAVWYGQEARMYALLVLLVALSLDRFLVVVERGGGAAAGWIIASALAIWSHFYGAFVVAAEALIAGAWAAGAVRVGAGLSQLDLTKALRAGAVRVGAGRRRAALLAVGFVLIGASSLPWLGPALTRLDGDQSYYAGAIDPGQVLRESFTLVAVGGTLEGALVPLGLVAFAVAMVAGLWALRRRPLIVALYLAAVVLPLALLLAVSWSRPKFHPRYLLLTLPAAQAIAASGLGWLVARPRPMPLRLAGAGVLTALAVPAAVGLANAAFDSRYARDDWRAAVAALDVLPGDAVALVSGHAFPVFAYYYGDRPFTPLPEEVTLSTQATLGYNLALTLNEVAARAERLWVVRWQDDVVDPNGFLTRLLLSGADREPLAAAPHGVGVERYRFRPGARFAAEPEIPTRLEVNFNNLIRLVGLARVGGQDDTGPLVVPAGEALTLTLYWQALGPLTADYKLALRLVGDDGTVWGRTDRRPAAYFYPTPRWKPGEIVFGDVAVPLDPTTPPGDYWLEVEMYAEDGARISPLDVLDRLGNRAGQAVRIAPLRVGLPRGRQPPVAIARPTDVTLAGVRIVGLLLEVYWRRTDPSPGGLTTRLVHGDRHVAEVVAPVGARPDSVTWPADWTWRTVWTVQVPPDTPAGRLEIQLGDGRSALTLATATVDPGERSFVLPSAIAYPLAIPFGEVAVLRGWDADRLSARAGQTVTIRLIWQAGEASSAPLKVFVHVVDGAGRVVAQRDAEPGDGRWPTTGWLPRQVVIDHAVVALPSTLPSGDYGLVVGLYDPLTGVRLTTTGGDSVRLGSLTVQ
jgi:4-amino-4-deoxy-L-arabinose transferase-like glycosyltransferase